MEVISREEVDILADGYNNWRKTKGWAQVHIEDIYLWEKYKAKVYTKILSAIYNNSNNKEKENKNGIY